MTVLQAVVPDAPRPPPGVEARIKEQARAPLNVPRLLFHSATAAIMVGSYVSLCAIMSGMPRALELGGDLNYLTILGMIVTVLCMAVSALVDLTGGDVVLISFKRLFLMVAMPVEIIISGVYWPLVLFAPHLILPPQEDGNLLYLPLWIDIGIHLVPAVSVLFDFFVFEERFRPPASDRFSAILAMISTILYAFWIEFNAVANKRFPYPFLDMMGQDQRLYVYMAAALFAYITFVVLNAVHK